MSKKLIIAVGAMMAVLHSAPAFAEEDLNACRKITDPAKRLECYDSLSNVPAETPEARVERQTENFGLTERQKAPENRKEVGEITGRIAALAGSQLTLDNGMVWKITDGGRLRDWLQVIRATRESVQNLIDRGLSEDEVVAARPTAEFDEQYGGGFMPPETYNRLLYQSLSR